MFRVKRRLLSTKALSPYAQALKHVALRGSAALGPSAKEQELKMYKLGTLPADYRPPVQGKWDDTIERWAYSWQFPATEESDEVTEHDMRKSPGFAQLVDFSRKLISAPPSQIPGSSAGSVYEMHTSPHVTSSSDVTSHLLNEMSEDKKALYDSLEKQLETILSSPETTVNTFAAPSNELVDGGEPKKDYSKMISAAEFSKSTNIPSAFLDDGSQASSASKELCVILEERFEMPLQERSICTSLRALSVEGYFAEAKALFAFAKLVGLGPNAEMYRGLMRYATSKADVNLSMSLIEEMKEAGVTPSIGNWHELMMCLHKARDYPAVQQVVDHMKAYANIEPNEITFVHQLNALAKDKTQENSLAEAVQLFDQMENVYGFIASRPHYHALMANLCQSTKPEMRLRCEELGKKMELMGIVWDAKTFMYQIMSAQVVGDIKGVEALFGKMRNEGVPMTTTHLSWAIHGHTEAMKRFNYAEMKERGEDPVPKWVEMMGTCFGIHDLVLQRGWNMTTMLLNALLRASCQVTMLAMEHTPDDTVTIGRLESQANKLWEKSFDEYGLQRDAFSYLNYISLLAHQQRIDEAEKLFQEMCLAKDMIPPRRLYEALIFMHLSSGEEGGAARSLQYLEAMERSKIPIRSQLIKMIVRVNNAAGYKRDMKRRARRIMQAREEYMARKEEGIDMTPKPYAPPERNADGKLVAVPLPIATNSALAWWEKWKRESINKNELFAKERDDGMPCGESFEEKNSALAAMGIETKFPTKSSVPDLAKHRLLPALRREEGEVSGAIWGLDGGELAYPKDGNGPQGWGVKLWRERQLIKKEYQKAVDGLVPQAPFSALGVANRSAGDQLLIEQSGVTTPQALSDLKAFPHHVYDDGTPKPASEMALEVSPSAELVWQQERNDRLAPYKSDEEVAVQADNTFANMMRDAGQEKMRQVADAIKSKHEGLVDIESKGVTRRSKHDYLAKWKEMYRHGTLEAPDEPLERFGISPDDAKETLSKTVRTWYEKNRRTPASEKDIEKWAVQRERLQEKGAAEAEQRTRRKLRKGNQRRLKGKADE